jgi:hypothetical protein
MTRMRLRAIRTGGYLIDFCGPGYDVAEKWAYA